MKESNVNGRNPLRPPPPSIRQTCEGSSPIDLEQLAHFEHPYPGTARTNRRIRKARDAIRLRQGGVESTVVIAVQLCRRSRLFLQEICPLHTSSSSFFADSGIPLNLSMLV